MKGPTKLKECAASKVVRCPVQNQTKQRLRLLFKI